MSSHGRRLKKKYFMCGKLSFSSELLPVLLASDASTENKRFFFKNFLWIDSPTTCNPYHNKSGMKVTKFTAMMRI